MAINYTFNISVNLSSEPGLHTVGRIATLCLRPCPKEYITPLQVLFAKVFYERLLLSNTCVTMRSNCHSVAPIILTASLVHGQRMDKRKSFVFARQYRNCFSRKINPLVPRNQPIKTAVGIAMHDVHGLKTMIFHRVADSAYF